MSAATIMAMPFVDLEGSLLRRIGGRLAAGMRALLRVAALAMLYLLSLADAAWLRIVTHPTGTSLAHARSA